MQRLDSPRMWLKHSPSPLARSLKTLLLAIRDWQVPVLPMLTRGLYGLHLSISQLWHSLSQTLWYSPLFRSQLSGPAPKLNLYTGMPQILGALDISVGERCRISGQTTFSGRSCGAERPRLSVGDNVDIGWQCSIAVGRRVVLGDNVRLAGRCMLAGYPGHPMDARRRAAGEPEDDHQVGDIVLERDVWLASGVSVMAGVTIGQGSVIAAGSVVTKDIPAGVLAAGVPAKVVKQIVDVEG
ncbi:acyltransferase [Aliagarivorans marinus]|uniref:acyltransferase n=1 Tax=Aliagarivorans marinus TaxID=561965 RepID=UPI0004201794|nr:acyltransferase [Aliagarivorans marinus]